MTESRAEDEHLLRSLPHLQLGWNTPLSERHADRLLTLLRLSEGSRVVDLGCGWGNLLLRALEQVPRLTGEGIDRNPKSLERARSAARRMGIAARVRFLQQDLVEYRGSADRAICIGADHAWESVEKALSDLNRRVGAGGLLLFGCGYWAKRPSSRFIDMFGPLPRSLEEIAKFARSSGWVVRSADVADVKEWDAFERSWRQDLEDIARREPHTALGRQAGRLAAQRRDEYENGYRGILGFAYLILERREIPDPNPPSTVVG